MAEKKEHGVLADEELEDIIGGISSQPLRTLRSEAEEPIVKIPEMRHAVAEAEVPGPTTPKGS